MADLIAIKQLLWVKIGIRRYFWSMITNLMSKFMNSTGFTNKGFRSQFTNLK